MGTLWQMRACSDTGPILHLKGINQLNLFKICSKVFISPSLKEELLKYKIEKLPWNFELKEINKDQVGIIAEKYSLDIGESSAIWLCKSLKVPLLLIDDLEGRETAISLEIKPTGTIGIIARCFREKIINKEAAIKSITDLYKTSSLFITRKLVEEAIRSVRDFEHK